MKIRLNRRGIISSVLCGLLGLAAIGCGGTAANNPGTVTSGAKSPVVITVGDAPNDKILSFEISINSISLVNAAGTSVPVLSKPTEIELTHLAGIVKPLVITSVPQDTYKQAVITVSNPEVTYLDPVTHLIVEKAATLSSTTVTINLTPAIVIGSNEQSLNFDFNLATSLSFDSSNNLTVNPMFTVSAQVIPSTNQEQEDGDMESLTGPVTSINGTSFTISPEESAQPLTFATDGSTVFESVSGVSGLSVGSLVEVDAVTQSDGLLLAKRVELDSSTNNDLEAEGLVASVTGNPATSFIIVTHDEETASTSKPGLGRQLAVSLAPTTGFKVNAHHVSLNGLPFTLVFDASKLSKGQNVAVEAAVPSNSNIVASKVTLEEQSLTGAVSAYTSANGQATFTLTVASDSAFAMLSGSTTVKVFQQPITSLKGISAIANGNTVRVRGLLFFDGTVYDLVASRVDGGSH